MERLDTAVHDPFQKVAALIVGTAARINRSLPLGGARGIGGLEPVGSSLPSAALPPRGLASI